MNLLLLAAACALAAGPTRVETPLHSAAPALGATAPISGLPALPTAALSEMRTSVLPRLDPQAQTSAADAMTAAVPQIAATTQAAEKGAAGEAQASGQELSDIVAGGSPKAALSDAAPVLVANEMASAPPLPKAQGRLRRVLHKTPWLTFSLTGATVAAYQSIPQIIERVFHGDTAAFMRLSVFDPVALRAAVMAGDIGTAFERAAAMVGSIFMHGDPNHLGRNMVLLLIFGTTVELATRRRAAMLALYLAAALAMPILRTAGLADPIAAYGASAAISGLAGATLATAFRLPHTAWQFLHYISAAIAVQYFANQVTFWVAAPPELAGIDFLSHIAGFLVGLALAWRLR